MNSDGGFHMVEKDDKLFLVYHHPKYQPIQQPQSLIPSGEAANNNNLLQPLFLCPIPRFVKQFHLAINPNHFPINSSPEYFRCFGATIKNLMSMVGATYAAVQIMVQTIIFVTTVIKHTTKNVLSLPSKSNTLTTLNILSNFTFIYLQVAILSVYVVEENQNVWYIIVPYVSFSCIQFVLWSRYPLI